MRCGGGGGGAYKVQGCRAQGSKGSGLKNDSVPGFQAFRVQGLLKGLRALNPKPLGGYI